MALAPGYAGEWWGRGRRFGITPLPGDRVYWWATKNKPAGWRAGDERGYVAEAFRGWADPAPELLAATPSGAVLRNDIVDRPPTPVWASGRAVLIGDAAHPTTPNLGQGGCMAIEDAAVLARRLLGGGEPRPTWQRSPRTGIRGPRPSRGRRGGSAASGSGEAVCRVGSGIG